MITIRIEFVFDEDRAFLIHTITQNFEIISESKIKASRNEKCKKRIQYLELVKKTS